MKSFKVMWRVSLSHLRSWVSNYRIWCIAILTLFVIHLLTKEIREFVVLTDTKISPYLLPFLFTQKYNRLLMLFPVVLLFCDAPFMDENQPSIIYRSGRKLWCLGQILYLAVASLLYFLFVLGSSILVNCNAVQWESDWGKVVETLARTNAGQAVDVRLVFPSQILAYFSPLQALFFSCLLLVFSGFVLGLLIFFCNVVTQTRIWGLIVSCGFLLFDAILKAEDRLLWFSPLSWNDLAKIGISETSQAPGFSYIMLAYSLISVFLIIGTVLIFQKRDLDVLPQI